MKIQYFILCFLLCLPTACSKLNICASNPSPPSIDELSRIKPETESIQSIPFLGINYKLIDTEEIKEAAAPQGYLIVDVISDSAADKTGLITGDIILEFDGINLTSVKEKDRTRYLSKYIQFRKKTGERICLKVLRQTSDIKIKGPDGTTHLKHKKELEKLIDELPRDQKLKINITNKVLIFNFQPILGERKNLVKNIPPNSELFPEYEKEENHYTQIIEKLIERFELQGQYRDIIARYNEDELWDDDFRLNLFRYLHRDPLKLIPIMEKRTDRLHKISKKLDFTEILLEGGALLDIPIVPVHSDYTVLLNQKDYLAHILKIIDTAWQLRQKAFERLNEQEISYLEAHISDLFERFSHSFYIERPDNPEDRIYNQEFIELIRKIDFSSLFYAALTMSKLTDPQLLSNLQAILPEPPLSSNNKIDGVSGNVLYSLSSQAGKVFIGGRGPNVYKTSAAVIIDLGGDDLYIGDANLVQAKQRLSAIIDISGNDEYLATEFFAQGSGILGIGLLNDLDGDDLYIGTNFSQGTAVLGIGILGDLKGNDRYFGEEFNQGTAFWGLGILLDAEGNDHYQSNLFAQGVGGVKGIGGLLDNAGDDFYFAGGRNKSSYGTSGVFQGSSQGFGIGFRGYASGGMGFLLDGNGDDSFWAGNFSQGTGYFFGMGIIRNFGDGDDTYNASRYGQGASAHSAAGILMDDGGNDRYKGYHVALQGAAWDLGIAAFIDKTGNDTYHGSNGFSQAAASHNGMAFFIDDAGIDQYFGEQGKSESNEYHGGSSLSFFIDGGGGNDRYSSGSNNTVTVGTEIGIRADLKDTVEDIAGNEKYFDNFEWIPKQ